MPARKLARQLSTAGVASAAEEVRTSIERLRGDGDDEETAACRNCGREGLADAMAVRDVVVDTRQFETTEPVVLCTDCEGAVGAGAGIEECRCARFKVDRRRALSESDRRCRGCGISQHRLRLDGQRLELHPIVPVDAGGHHHEFNVVPLCPFCHRKAHE